MNKISDNYSIHILDIQSDDINNNFIITIYGKTENDINIVCNIEGYKPYFYLKIPKSWDEGDFKNIICNKMNINKYYQCNIHSGKMYKDFYGFEWDFNKNKQKKYKFLKLEFNNYKSFIHYKYAIMKFYKKFSTEKTIKDKKIKQFIELCPNHCESNLYEANIHPVIRFIHEKNIEPSGWIKIKTLSNKYRKEAKIYTDDEKLFKCDVQIDCDINNISYIENNNISNLIIASFDIECDSLTGEFPQPLKNFKSLSIELYNEYLNWIQNINNDDIDENFKLEYFKSLIISAFIKNSEHKNYITYIDTINGIPCQESIDKLHICNSLFLNKIELNKQKSKIIEEIQKELEGNDKSNGLYNDNNKNIIINSDPIIQIGTVFYHTGKNIYEKYIQVIKPNTDEGDICDSLDEYNINVECCIDEKDMLLKWKDLINNKNPDIITGYNIFGFDFNYIEQRICFLEKMDIKRNKNLRQNFYNLGRIDIESDDYLNEKGYINHKSKECKLIHKNLSSSALGSNDFRYINMDGRVLFDVQKEIQKGHNLESYKLDNVSAYFMRGNIYTSDIGQLTNKRKYCTWIDGDNNYKIFIFKTNNIGHLKKGDYITINMYSNIGETLLLNGEKFQIIDDPNKENKHIQLIVPININIGEEIEKYNPFKIEWCLNKDDVSPQEIFRLHKYGNSEGRAKIAKYCIQDCELCIHLINLLDIIPNNIGMSNVCFVPFSYIYLRGQGVKVSSIVSKECNIQKIRMPTLIKNNSDDGGYEGAVVLEPKTGIYNEDPIVVLDYASLYPSSIIENNLSHDKFITDNKYLEYLKTIPADEPEINIHNYDKNKTYTKFDEIVEIIEYDDYLMVKSGSTIKKTKTGKKVTCYFIKNRKNVNGDIIPESQGVICKVLQNVLNARKSTREKMKLSGVTEFQKKVLDGLQLAYKVTANSVYGQLGAITSDIYMKIIAACTTCIGRRRIDDAENGVIKWASNEGYEKPEIIYGDTDSVFIKFSNKTLDGIVLKDKELLKHCIDCGIKAGKYVDSTLRKPQNLEYEKTFYPFILISKKRYVGDKYETIKDVENNNFKRTSMGIVMKRRDNAPIVKYVFGNIIEKIMVEKNFNSALNWLENILVEIKNGNFPINYFIITKSLRGDYKNPLSVAHKVLADRIGERDPGNKPKSNDRIPYAYITITDYDIIFDRNNQYKSGKNKGRDRKKSILQGNRIEHPEYIINKKLKLDYNFYITNQIMNPVKQVLDLNIKSIEKNNEIFEKYNETDDILYTRMLKYK